MFRLKILRVKNCRGVRNGPDLVFESGGLFLCGDNGTGKSSYIDAIEKVLTGNCGTFDRVQGISWANHAQHIQSPSEPEIELVITDGIREHTITLNPDSSSTPQSIQHYVNSAKESPFLLRRKTVLNFINSQPNERYKAIEEFLKLDEYAQFENKLKSLEQGIKKNIEDLTAKNRASKQTFEIVLPVSLDEPFEENTLITLLNEKIQMLDFNLIASLKEIEILQSQIDIEIKHSHENYEAQIIDNISSLFESIPDINIIKELINTYLTNHHQLLQKERELKGHFYSEILEKGVKWIHEDSLTRCPLCNNEIKPEEVVSYVKQQLLKNKDLVDINSQFSQSRKNVTDSLFLYVEIIKSIKKKWGEFGDDSFPESLEIIRVALLLIYEDINESISIEQIIRDNTIITDIDIEGSICGSKNILEGKKRVIIENTRHQNLVELKTWATYIQTNFPKYQSSLQELNHHLETQKNIKTTIKLAEQGRKDAVQIFIQSIGDKANYYFQLIHPDESIGNPKLSVTERGMGSIVLESTFYDILSDPRGYYSEGHLDSLGLCLFLAIRHLYKQKNPDFSLLILDDVLHSVDGQHRLATAQLIFNEFRDYQIIITTHDRLWFENLKLVSRNQSCKKYKISTWSLEDGPGFGDHKSDYEWLLSAEGIGANPADKVMKSGRLLEEILQNLCDSISICVPFRINGDYTIDPLWTNFYSKIKKSGLYIQYQETFDSINLLRFIRNQVGAHHNIWASGITDKESNQFSQSVVNLYDIVYCKECNRYIQRNRESDDGIWQCRCENLRYEKSR